jgi:hypothetical protein
LQVFHEIVTLLADAAGGFAVSNAALDAAFLLLRQVGRLRVSFVSDRPPNLLLVVALQTPPPAQLVTRALLLNHAFPAQTLRRQGGSADELHVKAAEIVLLGRVARFKQDTNNHGHGAKYIYRPWPAGAVCIVCA